MIIEHVCGVRVITVCVWRILFSPLHSFFSCYSDLSHFKNAEKRRREHANWIVQSASYFVRMLRIKKNMNGAHNSCPPTTTKWLFAIPTWKCQMGNGIPDAKDGFMAPNSVKHIAFHWKLFNLSMKPCKLMDPRHQLFDGNCKNWHDTPIHKIRATSSLNVCTLRSPRMMSDNSYD